MAYSKTYKRRKSRKRYGRKYGKRYRRSGGRSTRRIARRAYAIAKGVSSIIETKYSETGTASFPTLSSLDNDPGSAALLSGVSIGTSQTGRIGSDISVKSITLNFIFRWSSTQRVNYIRILVASDRQYSPSTTPAMSEFYQAYSGLPGQYDIFPLRNWNTRRRLKIIWSKVIKVEDTNSLVRRVNKTLMFGKRGWKCQFGGTGNTFTDCMYRPIFMFVWSDTPTVATAPTWAFYSRMTFKDA